MDLDEIFKVASEGCYLKPDQTIPYQTNFKYSQNQSKQVGFSEIFTVASDGCCLQPEQTIPYQTKSYQTKPTVNIL